MTSASITNLPVAQSTQRASSGNQTPKVNEMSFQKLMVNSSQQTSKKSVEDDTVSDSSLSESYVQRDSKPVIQKAQDSVDRNQIQEETDAFEENVKDVLKEELGISEEEVEQAMETLGLNYMDLAKPENLTQLIMTLTGTDSSVELLLTDEYTNILRSVHQLTGDLLQTTNMTLEAIEQMNQELQSVQQPDSNASNEMQTEQTDMLPEEVDLTTEIITEPRDETGTNQQNQPMDESLLTTNMDKTRQPVEEAVFEDEDGTSKQIDISVAVHETAEEANTSSQQDAPMDSKEQNSEKHSVKDHQNHLTAMSDNQFTPVDSPKTTTTQGVNAASYITDAKAMMEQIVKQARITFALGETTMEMELNPASLGKVLMEVTQKEGNISAHIYTQNETVKEALESQMVQLRENLNQQGVKVDSVQVSVATHEFEKNLDEQAKREQQQGEEMEQRTSRRRNIDLSDPMTMQGLMTEEEELVARMMRDNGNTVNYTA